MGKSYSIFDSFQSTNQYIPTFRLSENIIHFSSILFIQIMLSLKLLSFFWEKLLAYLFNNYNWLCDESHDLLLI